MSLAQLDMQMLTGFHAKIVSATVNQDGTVTLGIAVRNDGTEPVPITKLIVTNPPKPAELMTAAIGCDIDSKRQFVFLGNKAWALRVGPKKIRLVTKKGRDEFTN